MCEPILMGLGMSAATAASVASTAATVGTIVSVAGSVAGGVQGYQMAQYNAKVAQRQAQAAKMQAQFEEDRLRDKAARTMGSARAAYGKSGVLMEGSPLDVMAQSATDAEMDALALRWGGNLRANNYRAQARMDESEGNAALWGGFARAGTSLLTGASKWGGKTGLASTGSREWMGGGYA